MPIYEIEAPDGRVLEVEGDTPPNEIQLQEIFSAVAPAAAEEKESRKGLGVQEALFPTATRIPRETTLQKIARPIMGAMDVMDIPKRGLAVITGQGQMGDPEANVWEKPRQIFRDFMDRQIDRAESGGFIGAVAPGAGVMPEEVSEYAKADNARTIKEMGNALFEIVGDPTLVGSMIKQLGQTALRPLVKGAVEAPRQFAGAVSRELTKIPEETLTKYATKEGRYEMAKAYGREAPTSEALVRKVYKQKLPEEDLVNTFIEQADNISVEPLIKNLETAKKAIKFKKTNKDAINAIDNLIDDYKGLSTISDEVRLTGELKQLSQEGKFKFDFFHNTEKAPKPPPGDPFGQKLEPAGRFMNLISKSTPGSGNPKVIRGTIEFNNPLIVDFISTGPNGWKRVLSNEFGGKTGKSLSKAISKNGNDAIIAINDKGIVEEAVDLTSFGTVPSAPSKIGRKITAHEYRELRQELDDVLGDVYQKEGLSLAQKAFKGIRKDMKNDLVKASPDQYKEVMAEYARKMSARSEIKELLGKDYGWKAKKKAESLIMGVERKGKTQEKIILKQFDDLYGTDFAKRSETMAQARQIAADPPPPSGEFVASTFPKIATGWGKIGVAVVGLGWPKYAGKILNKLETITRGTKATVLFPEKFVKLLEKGGEAALVQSLAVGLKQMNPIERIRLEYDLKSLEKSKKPESRKLLQRSIKSKLEKL